MTYRVIQWGTGSIGKTCLRQIIDHPDLELVGLRVYSGAKEGKDAGEIARREPTGVIATRDIAQIIATDADVVIHTPRIQTPFTYHDADIIALLESGKNVITTVGHQYPLAHGPAHVRPLRAGRTGGRRHLLRRRREPGFHRRSAADSRPPDCAPNSMVLRPARSSNVP